MSPSRLIRPIPCAPLDRWSPIRRSLVSNPVVSFFFNNQNYHLEHHLFPAIPWNWESVNGLARYHARKLEKLLR